MVEDEVVAQQKAGVTRKESLRVKLACGADLCLHRIYQVGAKTPVFLLHGAIENSAIFFSKSGKGLAYYLAARGYDVFIPDLRGHGDSKPSISRQSRYGQTEAIVEDIPAFIAAICQLHPLAKQVWMAHSWGGVLLAAVLARFPAYQQLVEKCVYFACKRSIRVYSLEKYFLIDFLWLRFLPLLSAAVGYLPAKRLNLGSDDDTRKFLRQSIAWVRPGAWVDPEDGFDYAAALKAGQHPAVLLLAAKGDKVLGHPDDVAHFGKELWCDRAEYCILRRGETARHDYDHITLLTHAQAPKDHFPRIVAWLQGAATYAEF